MIPGMALRDGYRLEEARVAPERAVRAVPGFTDVWDVLRVVLNRGILAGQMGDLAAAERFLGEALSLSRLITSLFYCQRAVAPARQGRVDAAEVCRRRAV